MVTAVLHLNIGTAAGAEPVNQMAGCFGDRHDVIDLHRFCLADQVGRHARPGGGVHFFGVAQNDINLGHCSKGLRLCLGGASSDDQLCIRMITAQFADILPRLAHGLGGDGTGVDDHGVVDTGSRCQFLHRRRFIGVQAATVV